jgi:hypothetical protein
MRSGLLNTIPNANKQYFRSTGLCNVEDHRWRWDLSPILLYYGRFLMFISSRPHDDSAVGRNSAVKISSNPSASEPATSGFWHSASTNLGTASPSSRQRGRHKITNTQLSEGNFEEKEKLVTGPRWAPDTKTDWPTDFWTQINFNFFTLSLKMGSIYAFECEYSPSEL